MVYPCFDGCRAGQASPPPAASGPCESDAECTSGARACVRVRVCSASSPVSPGWGGTTSAPPRVPRTPSARDHTLARLRPRTSGNASPRPTPTEAQRSARLWSTLSGQDLRVSTPAARFGPSPSTRTCTASSLARLRIWNVRGGQAVEFVATDRRIRPPWFCSAAACTCVCARAHVYARTHTHELCMYEYMF